MINIFKRNKYVNLILYVCLLILPLTNINQGVDVSDSMYSLGNYLFPDSVYGVWAVSTHISNLVGSLIVRLPFGKMLIVANLYTSLFISITSIIVFSSLKKYIGTYVAFISQIIAICFCWIPSGILYNYLTYLIMTAGVIVLYKGVLCRNKYLLFLAGIFLGMNVFVRMPNITQMAFILVLWCGLYWDKITAKKVFGNTCICIGGYVAGLGLGVISVIIQYGFNGIINMITGLQAISSADESYSPTSMILDTFLAYVHSVKWLLTIIIFTICVVLLFKIKQERFLKAKSILAVGGFIVLVRFLWGRGMFSFRYYEDYSSMYEWGMMLLFLGIIISVYVLINKAYNKEIKLLAVITLIVIVIAPLGSNNYTYQNINNLFLVTPLILYVICRIIKNGISKEGKKIEKPIAIIMTLVTLIIMIQSFGFHVDFAFRDGTNGEKRTYKITEIESLKGMYTTEKNAKSLMGIYDCINEYGCANALYFGDCPGLSYILRLPCSISTTWPDLDSFSMEQFSEELNNLDSVVIIRCENQGYGNTFVKHELLMKYLVNNYYANVYDDGSYKIYIKDSE